MHVERAEFLEVVPVSDGGVGTVGSEETKYTASVEVWPLKVKRTLEAAQNSLKTGYRLLMWVDSAYTPQVNATVIVKGQRLTIQSLTYTDNRANRYELTTLSQ